MPQDHFQIALEHHRAGRLRQAEAGYRALLQGESDHPDALHWLGVLLFQAGRAEEAAALLMRAAAARPDDAAFHCNLGQACLSVGRAAEALSAFERAAALQPDRSQTLLSLAQAHLARGEAGDADAAVAAIRQAQATGLDSAQSHHDLGVALLAAGRADEAVVACQSALERKTDYASAYHYMALAHRALGDFRQIRKCLNKALEIDPAHARAWYALAALDAEAGNLEQSAGLFRRAIRAKSDYAAAYHGLAAVLRDLGRPVEATSVLETAERLARGEVGSLVSADRTALSAFGAPGGAAATGAVAELEQRLTLDPTAARFHQALAALANVFPPTQVPPQEVTDLFERYAGRFEDHLRGPLEYRVPELLAEALAVAIPAARAGASVASHQKAVPDLDTDRLDLKAVTIAAAPGDPGRLTDAVTLPHPSRCLNILDLGCGTGLCGSFLRPWAATLAGVDLSTAMIERARARGVYDRLEVGDLVEALVRSPQSHDLLVAADVLIYLGDLAPMFEASAAALRPGGLLAFTVEAGPGDRYLLNQQTRRYTHSEPYLRRLAGIYGFDVTTFNPIVVRTDRGNPVPGYLVILRSTGA